MMKKNHETGNVSVKKLSMSQELERSKILFMVITAIGLALTYVFTAFVNIRLPIGGNGGLIHLGNVPLFVFAILFGKRTGAIAGGFGMALFDITSGWALWSPFTLVTVGLMGYTVGAVTEKRQGCLWSAAAMLAALAIKLAGYYIAEGMIYGNWLTPMLSVPGNLIQVGTAMGIVLIIIVPLKKALGGIFQL